MKGRVVVGMSGGVDSSVAAWLLKQEGYEVVGVTIQTWKECGQEQGREDGGQNAAEDARRVANALHIPHYFVDFREEFRRNVIDYFVGEYAAGRTPNPCIACNRHVKWEALLSWCDGMGADYIATGHYARVVRLANGRYAVRRAVTTKKDQTYALYNLTQRQLSRTLMPLGEYTKEEVRRIAKQAGIPVADKPDSQEICFVENGGYAAFIRDYSGITFPPGNFVDQKGNIMGRHKGIIHYTVGQRKGLGLALPEPAYVRKIRQKENEVVLGFGREIFSKEAVAGNVNLMGRDCIANGMPVVAKIRYNHGGALARAYLEGDRLRCVFEEEQRAVTPGQALVLYDDDYVIGGGIILCSDTP